MYDKTKPHEKPIQAKGFGYSVKNLFPFLGTFDIF